MILPPKNGVRKATFSYTFMSRTRQAGYATEGT